MSRELYHDFYKFLDDLEAPYYKARWDMPYLSVDGWQNKPLRRAVLDLIWPPEK